jgi:hypothetical protein
MFPIISQEFLVPVNPPPAARYNSQHKDEIEDEIEDSTEHKLGGERVRLYFEMH